MSELLSAHAPAPDGARVSVKSQEHGDGVRRIQSLRAQHPNSGLSQRARVVDLDSTAATPTTPEFLSIDLAAIRLSTTPDALRARCRRRARREGREVVARLGAGVVAFKFGASWRLRFTG